MRSSCRIKERISNVAHVGWGIDRSENALSLAIASRLSALRPYVYNSVAENFVQFVVCPLISMAKLLH